MTSGRVRFMGSIACAAVVALAAPARGAEPTPWDQAKVTELAEQLAQRASAAYDAVYRNLSLSQNLGSGQSSDYIRLKDRIRIARTEARYLEAATSKGEGRDETIHSFTRLLTVVRDARVIGRRMMLDKPTLDTFAAANDVLNQIGAYYDPDALEKGPPPIAEPRKPD